MSQPQQCICAWLCLVHHSGHFHLFGIGSSSPYRQTIGSDTLQVVLFVLSMREKKKTDNKNDVLKETRNGTNVEDVMHIALENSAAAQKKMDKTRRQTFYTIFDGSDPAMPLLYASKGFFKMTG